MRARDADMTSTVAAARWACHRPDPRSRQVAPYDPTAAVSRGPVLTRRASLLLPLLLAACGGEQPQYFPPLRYSYLPPIRLNVAKIEIEQHFIPSSMPPDVTQFDPATPSDALRAMAQDRLQAFGSTGRAVFSIQDASLVRQGDTINGSMDVMLDVYPAATGPRAGFAEARVTRQHTGHIDDLRAMLYDMTKAMMDAMNVEFEYQIRNRLHDWLVSGTAVVPPVRQQSLDDSAPPTMPLRMTAPPAMASPAMPQPLMPSGR